MLLSVDFCSPRAYAAAVKPPCRTTAENIASSLRSLIVSMVERFVADLNIVALVHRRAAEVDARKPNGALVAADQTRHQLEQGRFA